MRPLSGESKGFSQGACTIILIFVKIGIKVYLRSEEVRSKT